MSWRTTDVLRTRSNQQMENQTFYYNDKQISQSNMQSPTSYYNNFLQNQQTRDEYGRQTQSSTKRVLVTPLTQDPFFLSEAPQKQNNMSMKKSSYEPTKCQFYEPEQFQTQNTNQMIQNPNYLSQTQNSGFGQQSYKNFYQMQAPIQQNFRLPSQANTGQEFYNSNNEFHNQNQNENQSQQHKIRFNENHSTNNFSKTQQFPTQYIDLQEQQQQEQQQQEQMTPQQTGQKVYDISQYNNSTGNVFNKNKHQYKNNGKYECKTTQTYQKFQNNKSDYIDNHNQRRVKTYQNSHNNNKGDTLTKDLLLQEKKLKSHCDLLHSELEEAYRRKQELEAELAERDEEREKEEKFKKGRKNLKGYKNEGQKQAIPPQNGYEMGHKLQQYVKHRYNGFKPSEWASERAKMTEYLGDVRVNSRKGYMPKKTRD